MTARRYATRTWTVVLLGALSVGPAVGQETGDESGDLTRQDQPRNLAVLDFRTVGDTVDPAAGEALAGVIRTVLIKAPSIRVIEREALADIMREQDLQLTDMVDPATAVQIGRIAGVDILVLGSVARVGDAYTVTSRLVDVATGETADAEEFELTTLDNYAKLGRLLAALIAEAPVGQDSIADKPRLIENFDGDKCELHLGGSKDGRTSAVIEKGRYLVRKTDAGDHYWWVPQVKGPWYLEVDLAQLEGPPGGACGLIWGTPGQGEHLSLAVAANGRVWIERAQGKTVDALADLADWPAVNPPPQSNRLRVESWRDRHRVFINGQCVDDFFEPGFRGGKIGLRTSLRNDKVPAVFAADNLVLGSLNLAAAGVAPEGEQPTKERPDKTDQPKRKRRARSAPRSAEIEKVWCRFEVRQGARGLAVHARFQAANFKGRPCQAVATFADAATNKPLRDRDGKYRSQAGHVAAVRVFTPRYRVSTYTDFDLFIPLAQLHLRPGQSSLKCRLTLSDASAESAQPLAASTWVPCPFPQ